MSKMSNFIKIVGLDRWFLRMLFWMGAIFLLIVALSGSYLLFRQLLGLDQVASFLLTVLILFFGVMISILEE